MTMKTRISNIERKCPKAPDPMSVLIESLTVQELETLIGLCNKISEYQKTGEDAELSDAEVGMLPSLKQWQKASHG